MTADCGMRQCALGRGKTTTLAWIPVAFAVEGKVLDLRNDDGSAWDEGWRVVAVFSHRVPTDYVRAHERDHMSQRAASDV